MRTPLWAARNRNPLKRNLLPQPRAICRETLLVILQDRPRTARSPGCPACCLCQDIPDSHLNCVTASKLCSLFLPSHLVPNNIQSGRFTGNSDADILLLMPLCGCPQALRALISPVLLCLALTFHSLCLAPVTIDSHTLQKHSHMGFLHLMCFCQSTLPSDIPTVSSSAPQSLQFQRGLTDHLMPLYKVISFPYSSRPPQFPHSILLLPPGPYNILYTTQLICLLCSLFMIPF